MTIPGSAHPLLMASLAEPVAPYEISRSLRFNDDDSAKLSKTFAKAGNERTWTWAGWVKRSALSTATLQTIFSAGTGGGAEASIRFNANEVIEFYAWTGGYNARLITTQFFRDASAWYHIVAVFDTSNATADQRIRLYINGVEVTTFSTRTNPSQNYEGYVNNSISHTIGDAVPGASPRFFDGYLADVRFLDGVVPGTATDATGSTTGLPGATYLTDLGEFDSNKVWQPKTYDFGTIDTFDVYGLVTNSPSGVQNISSLSSLATGVSHFTTGSTAHNNLTVDFGSVGTHSISAGGFIGATNFPNVSISDNGTSWTSVTVGQSPFTFTGRYIQFARTSGSGYGDCHLAAIHHNSFHLDFSDNSSSATLGDDVSGRNNDWTTNNLDAVAGTNYTSTGNWSWSNGAESNITNKQRLFDGSLTSGSPSAPSGNPGTVRYTWPTALTSFSKVRIYCNTHDDPYQLRRVQYNGANGTYTISTGSNTTAWYDITSNLNGTFNWVEWGSYGGSDGNRAPSGLLAIEIDDVLLVDGSPADVDSVLDTPTNYDDSTNIGGNYCTLNPLAAGGSAILANGNLELTSSVNNYQAALGTFALNSGKWYFEMTIAQQPAAPDIGWHQLNYTYAQLNNFTTPQRPGSFCVATDGNNTAIRSHNNSTTTTISSTSWAAGDVIGCAIDMDAKKIWFRKNNDSWYPASNGGSTGNPASGTNPTITYTFDGLLAPRTSAYGSTYGSKVNFGARGFDYSAPTGYKAICTQNMTDPTITDPSTAFDARIWTGITDSNTPNQTITGYNFSPDFVWVKCRSHSANHGLFDTVRGTESLLHSDTSQAADTSTTNTLTSFNSDGFTLNDPTWGGLSYTGRSFVGWAWDAGTTTVTNTDGTRDAQIRANPSTGFSIITWTGNQTNESLGHGLGAAPKLLLLKDTDNGYNWYVFTSVTGNNLRFEGLNNGNSPTTQNSMFLTNSSTITDITSTASLNTTGSTMLIYAFAPVEQYSSFGYYDGTGTSDNSAPFIYTGFRPRWILIRRYSTTGSWFILDAARNPTNLVNHKLAPNNAAEEDNNSIVGSGDANSVDFLSNGFKLKSTNGETNGSGNSFVYYAFAEHPFKLTRAR